MSHIAWALIGVAVLSAIVVRLARARRLHRVESDMGSVSDQWILQQRTESRDHNR